MREVLPKEYEEKKSKLSQIVKSKFIALHYFSLGAELSNFLNAPAYKGAHCRSNSF